MYLIRPTLLNFFLSILTGQKRDVTELKLLWPVNMTGDGPKIILSPAAGVQSAIWLQLFADIALVLCY